MNSKDNEVSTQSNIEIKQKRNLFGNFFKIKKSNANPKDKLKVQ